MIRALIGFPSLSPGAHNDIEEEKKGRSENCSCERFQKFPMVGLEQ
jgi:hypothetical protein